MLYGIICYNTDMSIANTISHLYFGAAALISVAKINTMYGPNECRWLESFELVTEFRVYLHTHAATLK